MYSRFLKALKFAEEYHKDTLRGRDIKVLELLGNYDEYQIEKEKKTEKFILLNEVLLRIDNIDTEIQGNHRISYFRNLLKSFNYIAIKSDYDADDDRVNFLVSIVKQIMNFEYMN